MRNVQLSKSEKAVIQELVAKPINSAVRKDAEYCSAVYSLIDKGFVEASIVKDSVLNARLLPKGRTYYESNPRLAGPFPWDKIFGVASIIAAVAAVLAFFVGCARLLAAIH